MTVEHYLVNYFKPASMSTIFRFQTKFSCHFVFFCFFLSSCFVVGNFPCTLSVLYQTLRRKGLGLEGSELDSEESMQVAADKYPLSEGMDLSVARQRFYVSTHTLLLSPHTQA